MYLNNDKYLNRLHSLIVEFGPNAKVASITPLSAEGIVRGQESRDRLLDGSQRLLSAVKKVRKR